MRLEDVEVGMKVRVIGTLMSKTDGWNLLGKFMPIKSGSTQATHTLTTSQKWLALLPL